MSWILWVLAGGFAFAFVMHRVSTRRYMALFGELAARHGGQVHPGLITLPTWTLEIAGARARITVVPGGGTGGQRRTSSTAIHVDRPVPETLRGMIVFRGGGSRFGLPGLRKLPVGNRAFSERFDVWGTSAPVFETFLDAGLQDRLVHHPRALRIHLTRSYYSIIFEGMTQAPAEVVWLLETARELDQRIQRHAPEAAFSDPSHPMAE